MAKLILGIVLMCIVYGVNSHTYHLGACPVVEPMQGFEINRMLGLWYVIQKTSTASHCITYNFTKSEEPGQYLLEQDSQHFILGLTPLKHDYKYTGVLTMKNLAVPAQMTVRFPLSVAGSASYTIMSTDYDNYALIFTCQKLTFAHRRSATILSRRKDLDRMYVDKMRLKLTTYGIDPFDLSIIPQNDCPKHQNNSGVNIDINPETFSSENIGNVVKKAGEKVATGVEFVVDTGKKVYHKVTDKKEDENLMVLPANDRNMKSDAEWLP